MDSRCRPCRNNQFPRLFSATSVFPSTLEPAAGIGAYFFFFACALTALGSIILLTVICHGFTNLFTAFGSNPTIPMVPELDCNRT